MTQYLLIYQGRMDGRARTRAGRCRWWGAERRSRRVGGAGAILPITGYNIVDADCLEAAKSLCDGHPPPRRRTG